MKLYEVEIEQEFDTIVRSIVMADSKTDVLRDVLQFNRHGINPIPDDDMLRISIKEIE